MTPCLPIGKRRNAGPTPRGPQALPLALASTLAPALALAALGFWPGAARADNSRSADSIWSQDDASQRALQQVPAGAQVDSTTCQEIGVGSMGGLPRYRCTVRFTPAGVSH